MLRRRFTLGIMVGSMACCAMLPGSLQAQQIGSSVYCAADADFSGEHSLADVVYLANFLFGRGNKPQPHYLQGDVNCSGDITILDVIVLVRHLYFKAAVCEFCGWEWDDSTGHYESQVMAMQYAGSLEPVDTLVERFQGDLIRIRSELSSFEPMLDGLFMGRRWSKVSAISIQVDSVTAHAILDSTYFEWDSLNVLFGMDSVWKYLWFEGRSYFLGLSFQGIKNPDVLADAYAKLPRVISSGAFGNSGSEWQNVYPYVSGDTVTYLLTQAWGDCPSGCINARYYYAKTLPDSAWYVGTWSRIYRESHDQPDWWDETCRNLNRVHEYITCDE